MLYAEVQHLAHHDFGVGYAWVAELEHLATVDTNQMVVLLESIRFLVHRLVVAKLMFNHEVAINEQVERVIHRGAAYTIVLILHVDVERLYIEVVVARVYLIKDGKALGGLTLPFFVEVGREDFLHGFRLFYRLYLGILWHVSRILLVSKIELPRKVRPKYPEPKGVVPNRPIRKAP
jgi:hypothetical protein